VGIILTSIQPLVKNQLIQRRPRLSVVLSPHTKSPFGALLAPLISEMVLLFNGGSKR
jgi:hypothetical protein